MGKVVKLASRRAKQPELPALLRMTEMLIEMAEVDLPFLYEAVGRHDPAGWEAHLRLLALAKEVVAREQKGQGA